MSTEIIRETYKTPEIYIDEREIAFLDEAEIELHFRDEIEDGLSMLFVEAADGSFEGIEMSEPDRLEPISPADGTCPRTGAAGRAFSRPTNRPGCAYPPGLAGASA